MIWDIATGYGSDFNRIKELNAPNVIQLGSLSPQELDYIYYIYNKANIFIMPNQNTWGNVEGFGLVVIELFILQSFIQHFKV